MGDCELLRTGKAHSQALSELAQILECEIDRGEETIFAKRNKLAVDLKTQLEDELSESTRLRSIVGAVAGNDEIDAAMKNHEESYKTATFISLHPSNRSQFRCCGQNASAIQTLHCT